MHILNRSIGNTFSVISRLITFHHPKDAVDEDVYNQPGHHQEASPTAILS